VTLLGIPLSDEADPRRDQGRIAVTPSGRAVTITITGDDRLGLIKSLPSRWPQVIMARERGETLDQIHRWAKVSCNPENECRGHCDPPCLRCHVAAIYTWMETELHAIAQRRARLLP
jgi:hypothetical protein